MIKQRHLTSLLALYLVLGSWKGYVALFRGNDEEPWQIFPTAVAVLPEADRTKLEEGIIIRSDAALQEILEDYLS